MSNKNNNLGQLLNIIFINELNKMKYEFNLSWPSNEFHYENELKETIQFIKDNNIEKNAKLWAVSVNNNIMGEIVYDYNDIQIILPINSGPSLNIKYEINKKLQSHTDFILASSNQKYAMQMADIDEALNIINTLDALGLIITNKLTDQKNLSIKIATNKLKYKGI